MSETDQRRLEAALTDVLKNDPRVSRADKRAEVTAINAGKEGTEALGPGKYDAARVYES